MARNRILLVDDNETSLKLLKALYESDYDVTTANDGLEALEALFQYKIDLVLTDILMPNMDGYHLTFKIRTNSKLKDIPVIVYTATYTSQSEENVALDMGASVYIRKPAANKLLLSVVKDLLAEPQKYPHKIPDRPESIQLMQQYSQKLITKLEQNNIELEEMKNNLEVLVKKRTAELEAANKELEAFSYSVSHDLHAPLRAIQGYVQMLAEDYGGQLDLNARQMMNNITRNAKSMGQLIDGLLTFSRLGRKGLEKEPIAMQQMVAGIYDELKNGDPNHQIEFKVNELPYALADNGLIKQVWVNLISNAVKYSRVKDKAVIEVGAEVKDEEIIYYVKDNGVGFDMQYAGKLFDVFQRLHSEAEFEGTGLGLALANNIISKHGGKIWAEAKENEGATFWFSLPKPEAAKSAE